MTPEEKFNQDIWWILQEIRKDELLTPKGGKIEFLIRTQPNKTRNTKTAKTDFSVPDIETQQKLLFKLKDWKAIDVVPVDNILRGSDIFNPKSYELSIKQKKFTELYKKYEGISRESSEPWIKPITKKLESGKLPYKKDGLFYSLWKYANASRLTGKSLIAFMDLAPLEGNSRFAIFEFLNSLKELKIELENITFSEDIYKKYCKTEHDYISEYVVKNPKADFSKATKKLFKNRAVFEDVFRILGKFDELPKLKLQLNGLLEFIEFSPSPSAKNKKALKEHLDTYIKCFIDNKLFSSELRNFYQFSRQKEIFLYQIEREARDYGLEFVFGQGEVVSVSRGSAVSIGKDEAYLFVHTLAALEKQNFFEVESILITDMDVPPEKQTDDYKVKITASEKLHEEFRQKIVLDDGSKSIQEDGVKKSEQGLMPETFTISVRDREIRVNDWLIGKPHAVGSNFEFFEHIRSQKPNTKINRATLPDFGGSLSLKEQVKNKSFIKIVNELGFKSQILKAFFYSRGKDTLTYRGDKISKDDLEKAGVKKALFLKELELAHTRNSPE